MNIQKINIRNDSSSSDIYVSLNPSEDANIPEFKTSHHILPLQEQSIAVSNGTMNMFVWTDPKKDVIWSGIVPTKTEKTIVINPTNSEVYFNDMILPKGFGPITSFDNPSFMQKNNKGEWFSYFVVSLLIVLFLFGVLWYMGKIKF